MRNVKVVVEYDGTDYCGFQYQPGVPTIQAELEAVLEKILKHKVTVYGSGRTDAGVHAAGQVINLHTHGTIPVDRVCVAMNSLLPVSIAALQAEEADASFHARSSAKSRLYRYVVLNRQSKSALQGRYCWHVRGSLDVEEMRDSAKALLGTHDFSSFAAADRDAGCPIRDVHSIDVCREGDRIAVEIRANAFLRGMARIIVGTLVEVGLGFRPGSDVASILQAADRRVAGKTAPARGLCLVEVEY